MTTDFDEEDFIQWLLSFFDNDALFLNLAYQMYLASKDKHMTGIGLIVEREDKITDTDIKDLEKFLNSKRLRFSKDYGKLDP